MYTLYFNEVYDGRGRHVPHDGISRTAETREQAIAAAHEVGAFSLRMVAGGSTYFFARNWDGF